MIVQKSVRTQVFARFLLTGPAAATRIKRGGGAANVLFNLFWFNQVKQITQLEFNMSNKVGVSLVQSVNWASNLARGELSPNPWLTPWPNRHLLRELLRRPKYISISGPGLP